MGPAVDNMRAAGPAKLVAVRFAAMAAFCCFIGAHRHQPGTMPDPEHREDQQRSGTSGRDVPQRDRDRVEPWEEPQKAEQETADEGPTRLMPRFCKRPKPRRFHVTMSPARLPPIRTTMTETMTRARDGIMNPPGRSRRRHARDLRRGLLAEPAIEDPAERPTDQWRNPEQPELRHGPATHEQRRPLPE